MPLALSVSCPGELGDSLPAIEQLKDRLFREEKCCVESVGWVHGFVVRLQEQSLAGVKALLAAEGCTVDRITEQHYEWPTSVHDAQQHWRHREPWNQQPARRDESLFDEIYFPQKPQQEAPIVVSEPEPVLLPFTHAA